MKIKFNYSGHTSHMSVSVSGYHYTIYIEHVEVGYGKKGNQSGYECYSEGGSYGVFKTLGKALAFAEKNLIEIIKNNPE